MNLYDRKTGKVVKKGEKIKNNVGREMTLKMVKANMMIDCEEDTDLHPASFQDNYKVEQ